VRRRRIVVAGLLGAAALGCVSACGGGASSPVVPTVSGQQGRAAASVAAEPYDGQQCDAPSLIAHRGETGDGRNLPENTWQSELAAAAEGASYLNMDVRWTSDGVPVALHDGTVNRTTSETRADTPITTLTAQQYTALYARDYAGDTKQGSINTSVHPDTLAEVLAKVAATGKPIVLQIEADPDQSTGTGAAKPAAEFTELAHVIESSGYATKVIVAGWTLEDLKALHTLAPNIRLAYLFETIGARSTPTPHDLTAVGANILYVDYRGITASLTTTWHAAGIQVWAWTPAQRSQWSTLRTDDVDAVATNWASFYLSWAPQPCPADSSV